MPFMIFDRTKKALQFVSNADLFTGTTANMVAVVKADVSKSDNSFRAHNMSSVGQGDGELDSNGPWAFGSYKLTWREAQPEWWTDLNKNGIVDQGEVKKLWTDSNGNGILDDGESNKLDQSYSGRGYYRFGLDTKNGKQPDYDNLVPFLPVRDPNGDGNPIDGAVAGSTAWQMELAQLGYRSNMDIHAGKAAGNDTQFYNASGHATLGCIRVDDSTLKKLDQLHGLQATFAGQTSATGLLIVDNVAYVGSKSTNTNANVALVDAREFGVTQSPGTLSSGSGNDYLFGSQYQNELKGNNGNDRLFGKGGSDTLIGGQGSDGLYGGTGSDVLIGGLGKSDAATTAADLLDGGWGGRLPLRSCRR